MTDHGPSTDLSGHDRMDAKRSGPPSQALPGSASQPHHSRTSTPPRKARGTRPDQSSGHINASAQKGSPEITDGDFGEQITLLPYDDQQQPVSDASPSGHHTSPSEDVEKADSTPTTTLHRSGYILFIVFIYSSLALTAWVLICLLTFKPLTTDHYGFHTETHRSRLLEAKYAKSEEIYRAARTIQALVSVLTIPLTSAVCSAAAVVFAQSSRRERRLTVRQVITLADKGWNDPTTIARLLFGHGKRLSSSLLVFALLLNILGASITPLQTLFLSQKTIKTPTWQHIRQSDIPRVIDVPDKLEECAIDDSQTTLVTVLTRNALKSTFQTTPQPRLWQESIGCSSSNISDTERCVMNTATLSNVSELSSPFLAQLPVGYHTGLVKQFSLRINSTVTWETILSPDEIPADCNGGTVNSFYARYANATSDSHWSIEACVPGYQHLSPWKHTYSRQDFTEVLYLNISVVGYGDSGLDYEAEGYDFSTIGGIFKITSETTAGYFELPNYMNRGQAGSLIDGDPDNSSNCGFDCEPQVFRFAKLAPRAASQVSEASSLATVANKGPLLTVAIALFGNDLFIADRVHKQQNFDKYEFRPEVCVDQKAMSSLLLDDDERRSAPECILDAMYSPEELDRDLAQYLQSFYLSEMNGVIRRHRNPARSQNAFASAVFLATEAWLTSDNFPAQRYVSSDSGADISIPAISRAGMILISSLWGVYLACLFGLAIYSVKTPRWTNQLDGFAMMRIGAAVSGQISLDVADGTKGIEALDQLPGFIGDATGGEGDVGALGIGATTPLNGVRPYRCYERDGEENVVRRTQYDTPPNDESRPT